MTSLNRRSPKLAPVFFTLALERGIVPRHEIRCRLRHKVGYRLLLLALGLLLFIGLHQLRELGWRGALIARFGLGRYKGLMSLGVILSIVLIVLGKGNAQFMQVWVPPFNLRSITHLLMISACILVVAGSLPNSYTREIIGHPMLIGVIVWSFSHLLSNGDLASLLLFGSLGLWALLKIINLELNKGHRDTESETPKASLIWDGAAIALGMIAYILLLVFHGPLFGFALVAFN